MDILTTYPSVIYHVYLKSGELQLIDNPVYLPDPSAIDRIEEPVIKCRIISDLSEYRGAESVYPLGKYSMCPILSA